MLEIIPGSQNRWKKKRKTHCLVQGCTYKLTLTGQLSRLYGMSKTVVLFQLQWWDIFLGCGLPVPRRPHQIPSDFWVGQELVLLAVILTDPSKTVAFLVDFNQIKCVCCCFYMNPNNPRMQHWHWIYKRNMSIYRWITKVTNVQL